MRKCERDGEEKVCEGSCVKNKTAFQARRFQPREACAGCGVANSLPLTLSSDTIVKIVVKGRGEPSYGGQRVDQLKVMTADLTTPLDPSNPDSEPRWEFVTDPTSNPPHSQTWAGNHDQDTPQVIAVDTNNHGRVARAVRIVPISCVTHCSMRFEVYVRV